MQWELRKPFHQAGVRWAICLTVCLSAASVQGQAERKRRALASQESAWLDGFRDGISHWQKKHDKTDYPRFRPEQVVEIADNILLLQRDNGGWRPNDDPLRIPDEQERRQCIADKGLLDTSFDNRNTYTQVEYLARAFGRHGEERHRQGCIRGIGFILSAQYDNGGFPHSFPNKKNYYPHITIQDDVMVGVLRTLHRIADGPPFEFIDADLQRRCKQAAEKGDRLLLRLQVRVGGVPTIWAGQYDEHSLMPCMGRTFELPGLSCAESVTVVRYLMEKPNPDEDTRRAIESAVAWFERSKIRGLRIERAPAPTVKYEHHTSRDDVVAVEDSNAPPLWARFYDIETNQPFMANRDGKKVYKLHEVTRERRTGANWYGYYPRDLLAREYPAWKKRVAGN